MLLLQSCKVIQTVNAALHLNRCPSINSMHAFMSKYSKSPNFISASNLPTGVFVLHRLLCSYFLSPDLLSFIKTKRSPTHTAYEYQHSFTKKRKSFAYLQLHKYKSIACQFRLWLDGRAVVCRLYGVYFGQIACTICMVPFTVWNWIAHFCLVLFSLELRGVIVDYRRRNYAKRYWKFCDAV